MAGGNIKVVVRVRPFNSREKDRNAKCIVQMKDSQTVLIPPPGVDGTPRKGSGAPNKNFVFNFDRSYWSFNRNDAHYAGQDNLFDDLGGPLLDNAFQGYNNCIFAYGQTGSGKSYSMMGYGEEAGIIPKICAEMFQRINKAQLDSNLKCTVEVSYLEIYNERVRDLLNPTTKGALKVREHPSLGPYVEDLAKLVVGTFREIENLMDEGNKARTVAATNMNETSSRSHAVFTLILTQKRHDAETGFDTEKVSRISLVDLAGSERATSTGATGARLKEGAEINRSLSTLGRVIAALADLSTAKRKKDVMVPYRDSVLTWLLKDSLGGNSMTAMIAAISPADINWDETLSTLRYADSAKRIKNHAVVNEDPNARMIRELKEELMQLRSKLSGGNAAEEESYAPDTPLEKQIVTITAPDGSVRKVSKAEIAEQLGASEKLLTDLNQTWEERLEKTQQIQKERETALEELGISIEKDFIGMSMPKRIPHLVNLSDDPLLAECLVYNIKPGITHVGNVETSTTAQIRLNGSKILNEHCQFENVDGVVTLVPTEGAAVMVNGLSIEGPRRLRTGYRVILGDFHIFRFNHPQEARADRDKLRQSVAAGSLQSPEHRYSNGYNDGSDADSSRPDSPAMVPANSRDTDWSFARKEAGLTMVGDYKSLSDEQLDLLIEETQRVRIARKGQFEEDDTESMASYAGANPKSNTTFDDLSTEITVPSTPQPAEQEEQIRQIKDFQERLRAAEEANVEVEEIKAEKVKMEEQLLAAQELLEMKLEEQKKDFERKQIEMESRLEEMSISPSVRSRDPPQDLLTKREKTLARFVVQLWKRRNYVRMAETVLQHAATLKEAQIMSNEMEKNVFFQFTIVDVGHTLISSYDLFLNDVNTEDDEVLENAMKPCVGVRVMDFKEELIHLWSLEKLQMRALQMRQKYQYLDRPDFLQHFRLSDPFSEQILPQYTLIGDTDVPLAAVFDSRRQDFGLEIISPHTNSVVGIVKVSLEPSGAEVPKGTISFNVVMHHIHGLAEREGTEVHAQMFIPGLSATTTTNKISNFDEGPVAFESTHTMSAPLSKQLHQSMLRIAIFANVTAMHLEKLMSWDEMRDQPVTMQRKKKAARLAETEFYTEEKHDVFGKVQILEPGLTGEYMPVEVLQHHVTDAGAFQLHQGLQRRLRVSLTHSSGDSFTWKDISDVKVGQVKLLDAKGHVTDSNLAKEVTLGVVKGPSLKTNSDGSSELAVVTQWDSSLHNSLLLDRTTAPNYRVQVNVQWAVSSDRLAEPMKFSLDLAIQIQGRVVRSPSKFMQMFTATRTVHAVAGPFQLVVRPAVARRAGDLWRMNTSQRYVKGEEYLGDHWTPRGVSLIKDYLASRRRRMMVAEVEAVRGLLSSDMFATIAATQEATRQPADEKALLKKFANLWPTAKDPSEVILINENCEPPQNGAAFALEPTNGTPRRLIAEVTYIPKSADLLKSGYIFTPDSTNTKWIRRYLELRKPYLHVHSVPDGDELIAINLTHCRIDHEPQVAKLLKRDVLFAIYAPHNTYVFAPKTDRERVEWIMAIDKTHFGRSSSEESL